jgi:anti-anti-sigma factor
MKIQTSMTRTVSYNRRKDIGCICLSGICDIFEAVTLHEVLTKAVSDAAVKSIVVDCEHLERIDSSCAQLLASLYKSCQKADKVVSVIKLPGQVDKYLKTAGVSL